VTGRRAVGDSRNGGFAGVSLRGLPLSRRETGAAAAAAAAADAFTDLPRRRRGSRGTIPLPRNPLRGNRRVQLRPRQRQRTPSGICPAAGEDPAAGSRFRGTPLRGNRQVQLRPRQRTPLGICPAAGGDPRGTIPLPRNRASRKRWAEGGAPRRSPPPIRAPIPGGGRGLDPPPGSAAHRGDYGSCQGIAQPACCNGARTSSARPTRRARRPAIAAFVTGGSARAASSRRESDG
jgi:hypothetical protein